MSSPWAGQHAQPQRTDVAYHQPVVGWRVRQPDERGLAFGHVAVGPMLDMCEHVLDAAADLVEAVLERPATLFTGCTSPDD